VKKEEKRTSTRPAGLPYELFAQRPFFPQLRQKKHTLTPPIHNSYVTVTKKKHRNPIAPPDDCA